MKKLSFVSLLILVFSITAFCQTQDSIVLNQGLVLRMGRPDGNKIISPNVIEASIVTNNWQMPKENEVVKSGNTIIGKWERISTNDKGWYKHDSLYNAYVYLQFKSDKEDIAILEQRGNRMVYVNGIPRSGNPYGYQDVYNPWEPRFDYSYIPVKLKKGINEFLFFCRRGLLKAVIHPNKEGLIFNNHDLTIPDLIVNKAADTYGAIPIINATENNYKGLMVKTWIEGSTPAYYPVKELNPLSIFKTPFYIKTQAQKDTGKVKLNIAVVKEGQTPNEQTLASTNIILQILFPDDTFRETFISKMDGSVQYYAVNPPKHLDVEKPALFLSLHGAGVEAINQAHAYYHKDWGYIVAPTNRRPYGYNWENWGRLDALEVLNIAKKEFDVDPSRVYLTGHSMGGHGTWHLGINYPDLFGAIGPSAGWISLWSYRIRSVTDSTKVKNMLLRATKQSDTYAFTKNLKPDGIYIIQGAIDDNVPPEQAESMVANLSKFHKDFIYYVQPGANHWWDVSDEPGADCVDWPPLFDFFAHHAVANNNEIKIVDFTTANPSIASKNYWIKIINQDEQQTLSHIHFELQPGLRKFIGSTSNINMFSIDVSMLSNDKPITVVVDSQTISNINIPNEEKIYLLKNKGKWELSSKPNEENKTPARCGNFREALNHDVVFVYGTHGNKKENTWAFQKSRYDAEKIWYQGNGSIETIKDDEFDPVKYKDRSVILFGNSETNSAWDKLLKDSPVQVNDDEIKVGDKNYKGSDYACLMIRPRTDSKVASVGVVSGTGIEGMNLINLADYFDQYVSYPDVIIYNSDILKSDETGVKFTGYFGNDWSLSKGDFVTK